MKTAEQAQRMELQTAISFWGTWKVGGNEMSVEMFDGIRSYLFIYFPVCFRGHLIQPGAHSLEKGDLISEPGHCV